LAVQATQSRASQRPKGPPARLAAVALQAPRLAVGHRPERSAPRTGAPLIDAQFDRRDRRLPRRPPRQNLPSLRLLRLRQRVDPRQPCLKCPPLHKFKSPRISAILLRINTIY